MRITMRMGKGIEDWEWEWERSASGTPACPACVLCAVLSHRWMDELAHSLSLSVCDSACDFRQIGRERER